MSICKYMMTACTALAAVGAVAKTCTWSGGGGDKKWSTAANWVDSAVPESGDTVVVNITDTETLVNTNDIDGLSLASLTFTGTKANTVFAGKKISLAADGTATVNMRGNVYVSFDIPSSATLTFNNTYGVSLYGVFSGAGVIEKTGSGTLTISSNSPSFDGAWNMRNGTIQLYAQDKAFGDGIVNVYGKNLTAGTTEDASLLFLRNVTFANDFHLYYDASIESRRGVTLSGDVTFHTGNGSERCTITAATDSPNYGFVNFTGTVSADPEMNSGSLLLKLSHANHAIRFQGPAMNLQNRKLTIDATEGTVALGAPISSTYADTDFLTINNGVKIVMGCENALPGTAKITFGTATIASGLRGGIDLNGYSQRIGTIYASASSATVTNRQYLTSTGGPATFTLQAARLTSSRTFCDFLNGEASIEFAGIGDGNVPRFDFYGENTTSGRIISRVTAKSYWYGTLPNLKEVEVTGTGRVYISVPSAAGINSDVEFNVHDIVENSGYISITTGLDIYVARVMYNNIDLPAATYGKSASVWLSEGAGRCIVRPHVYRWVWTGNGAGSSVSTAENWATNASPSSAGGNLVLDFSRAGDSAAVSVDAPLTVAGLTSGTNANAVALGGSSTLAITGSGTNTLVAALAAPLSITYSGTGRQVFSGNAASSLEKLTLDSGVVAFSGGFSPVMGSVDIASGAKLELDEDVHATCGALYLAGKTEHKGTHGSDVSSAKYRNSAFFAGAGDLSCLVGLGLMVIVE